MKPEPILKPEKTRNAKGPEARTGRSAGAGASVGMPVFLKEARASGTAGGNAMERQADEVAEAASGGAIPRGKANGPAARPSAAAIPTADAGAPLENSIRDRAESVLGTDLSHVRVHEAAADRAMAGGMNARAFTHGQHIWMGPQESSSDLKLMTHEAAHVAQQGVAMQPPLVQRQQKTATVTAGTTVQMVTFVNNPQFETEPSLRTVLTMLNRYQPTVDVGAVDFRVMALTQSYVGSGLTEDGRSHWEGNKPVIELTQEKYDTIAQHLAGTADVSDVHGVVRTVGHELYHLYREKTGNQANPIQPLFAAESSKRMEQIRQNWLEWAKGPGGHKQLGIPESKAVTKWEDIPAAERTKIEQDASQTAVIQGFYEQTAYLVEETYVRIEEISYLRVQQQAEAGPKKPSQASVSQIAQLIWRFNTALDQTVGNVDFMTPELLAKTKVAMLDFLRKRYPHRADPSVDSYEVIFYLNARANGMAPLYDDTGALISVVPPGAQVK
jgi:Domain of unknown function (DUF4157)